MQRSRYVGLHVHRETISMSVARCKWGREVCHWVTISHRPDQIRKLAETLASDGSRLIFFCEAGPACQGLLRQIVMMGHDWTQSG
jgi:hypothetical protein